MVTNFIEIYPYGKTKKLKLKPVKQDYHMGYKSNLEDYTHHKYLELFTNLNNFNEIIINVLEKLITITNSKDGFIGIVEPNSNLIFKYHSLSTNNSKLIPKDCRIQLTEQSLLGRSIKKGYYIISNDLSNDPRSNGVLPEDHIKLNTFCGIPLLHNDIVIGQIGLANSKKYKKRYIYETIPLQKFITNFIHLLKERRLSVNKTLELKKQVNILKDSFIATMSHEIRTPLNGIVGMASLLKDSGNLNDKQEKHVHIILECSSQLMELVNDILDYSKISSGGLILLNQPFNLKSCLTKVKEIVGERALNKSIDLQFEISDNLPENLTGDCKRIKQILFNLITNGIKFTENGYVSVKVSYEDIETEESIIKKKIIFIIEDTGIGIKPEDQERIFEVFTKINKDDNFYVNTSPGVGMGLAITKFLIQQMGGDIKVESDGIKGSKFTFYIILDDETDIKSLLELYQNKLQNKNILIVDDNEDNRIFLMDALHSWNIKPTVFSSARETLNYVEKYYKKNNNTIDLMIIDLCMPNMSGLELAQGLRERGYLGPIIGLSSIGSDILAKEWFDYFHVKPITKSILFNLILKALLNKTDKKSIINSKIKNVDKNDGKLKIIVAEDDFYNQVLMKELLEMIGYSNIKIVINGKLCLDEIKKEHYDICLMDVKMPVMDGLEATRLIKKVLNPPIIIGISASVLDSDKSKCFAAGMDGYIPKPIQIEQLKSVISSLEYRINSGT